MSAPFGNIPARLLADVARAGYVTERTCDRCGEDSDGYTYCAECSEVAIAEKDAAITKLRNRLTTIHQLCERIQAIGSEPPAKGGSHSAQFGRSLALVREIEGHAHWTRGR